MCNKKLLLLIFIVTIITGIIGLSGRDFFEGLFQTPKLVALALIFTGIILILTRGFMHGHRDNFKMKDALILGLTQGIAIVPGISRCGITISTLLFRGFTREAGFRISFLASIPAILGAAILEAKNIGAALKIEFTNFLFGFIFSLLSGLLSLWLLKLVMRKARLYYFGYYCIVVAIITLLFIK
jgi:undecaprenyl-diphosphatase